MSNVICQISISLDGYVAGPDQSADDPLGQGGERLHEWAFADDMPPADKAIRERYGAGVGAYVMGRNMFGPDRGPHDVDWRGWWGEDPPYHVPVFVLTHHERAPLEMDGGTTFHFVTDGIESALAQARAAAGDGNVEIAGGASTVRQFLAAGLLEELHLHIAPVLLGGGERLFDDAGDPTLEPVEVVASPAVTHVRYRITP
jgi:dihydrofolate reductase